VLAYPDRKSRFYAIAGYDDLPDAPAAGQDA